MKRGLIARSRLMRRSPPARGRGLKQVGDLHGWIDNARRPPRGGVD